jgi:hypothetical protein
MLIVKNSLGSRRRKVESNSGKASPKSETDRGRSVSYPVWIKRLQSLQYIKGSKNSPDPKVIELLTVIN